MLEVPPPHAHPPSFIYPSIILLFPPFSQPSFSPTHFTQNTFLSFILFPSASYSSHLSSSSSSSSSLPPSVFWTFLLVLSVALHPASPPPFPPWWMSLSARCSSYLLSRGAQTVSLSCPPHLYPSTKETERARGYSGMKGGERPWSRDSLQESPP